jgi:hypothetical protein
MKYFFSAFLLMLTAVSYAQVGLNTTTVHPSAQLQLESTQKGFLMPRLEQTQINGIVAPAEGLLLYNTSLNYLDWFNGQQWINPKTKPNSPSINTISTTATSATLNFTNSTNSYITGYEVQVQPGNLVVSGTSSPIVVTDLLENKLYSFTLISVTSQGKGMPSPMMQATTLYTAPAVPTQLDVSPSNSAVTVSWNAANSVISNYIVAYKEVNAVDWLEMVATTNSLIIPNLINESTYTFKVKAVNSVGESAFSNILYASPSANDVLFQDSFNNSTSSLSTWNEFEGSTTATNNLVDGLITISNGRLKLQGSGTNTNYRIASKSSFGKDNANLVVQFNVIMPSCQNTATNSFRFGGTTTTSYHFLLRKTNATTINSFVNLTNAPTTPINNNLTVTCTDDEVLHFKVVFNQSGGNITVFVNGIVQPSLGVTTMTLLQKNLFYENYSTVTFEGNADNFYYIEGITVSGKPMRPTRPNKRWQIPSAYPGNNAAMIHFDLPSFDGGSPITGYEITSNPVTSTVTGTSFPMLFPNLVNGTSYTFSAKAINAFGISNGSQASDPITPTNSFTTLLFYPLKNSVLLQWKSVSDAVDYVIEYKETSSSVWLVFNDGVSTKPQTTVTGLINGVSYNFRVKPLTNFGIYDYSIIVTTSPTNIFDSNCWNQIVSSGQSLSLGGAPAITTTQPYNNKWESNGAFIPLVETGNETMSSTLANSISQQVGPTNPFNSVVSLRAAGGTPYTGLKKGTINYNRNIDAVIASKKIANDLELKPYLVRGLTIVHGENDYANTSYKQNLIEWQNDYETDFKNVTGQVEPIPMFTCQVSTWSIYGGVKPVSALAQLDVAIEQPEKFVLVAPKYFFEYQDGVHLKNYMYKLLGEYYGRVMKKVIVDREPWLPLHATSTSISGNIITVNFHVPSPPLQINTTTLLEQFHYGFEYFDDTQSADIQSVALGANGTSVIITLTNAPTGTNKKVAYAYTGIPGQGAGPEKVFSTKGNLCDSDSTPMLFPGNYPTAYGTTLKNWCVTFIKNVE